MTSRICIILALLLGLFCPKTHAQSISVKSFYLAENDMSALDNPVIDQNGNKCALIRVQTTQKGFVFDVGSLGVSKVDDNKVGEVWVYVPAGVKHIDIRHATLGSLVGYRFDITIQSARTYIMELTSDEIQTIVKKAVTAQYVMFQLNPKNAVVELNGELLETNDGVASKRLPFGTYGYKVQAPRHAAQEGTVEINDPKNKHIVDVRLVPQYSTFTFKADNNAEIWINDQKRGSGTCNIELGYGSYLVETRLPGHRPAQIEVTLTQASAATPIQLKAPTPIYGALDINSKPGNADVWLDNRKVGTTPIFIDEALVGKHTIKVVKQGYKDYTQSVEVREGETSPISAALEQGVTVDTTPSIPTESPNKLTFNVDGVVFNMIKVEHGTFQMGSTSGETNEKPIHSVTISKDYYLGETEVTQALWKAVTGESPTSGGSSWSSTYGLGDNYPAYSISYEDVQSFITKLNQKTGRKFRMPTEAEWEFAAKGGNMSKGYTYSGSNNIKKVAWYEQNSFRKRSSRPDYSTHPVKKKSPNELGIYDMSGNVREWCSDWYGSYSSSAVTDPTGPASGSHRVRRSGSWGSSDSLCRTANRDDYSPSRRSLYVGFRLAL